MDETALGCKYRWKNQKVSFFYHFYKRFNEKLMIQLICKFITENEIQFPEFNGSFLEPVVSAIE